MPLCAGGGTRVRDPDHSLAQRLRQPAVGANATQQRLGVTDAGDVLGVTGMVCRGVQDTTGE